MPFEHTAQQPPVVERFSAVAPTADAPNTAAAG
jgi:hypothetical protein